MPETNQSEHLRPLRKSKKRPLPWATHRRCNGTNASAPPSSCRRGSGWWVVLAEQPPARGECVAEPDEPCDKPNPLAVCVCGANLDGAPIRATLVVRSGSSVAPIAQCLRSFGLSLGVRVRILRKRVFPRLHQLPQLGVSLNVCAMAEFIISDTTGCCACRVETYKNLDAFWALVCVSVDRV